MSLFQVKQTVFRGTLQVSSNLIRETESASALQLCRHADKPTLYSIVGQTVHDLREPDNSPSVSMWPYLLLSAQSQRLNEISIYVERSPGPVDLRYLYFNDLALTMWDEMGRTARVLGRLHRPPRSAVLSFGMPFSE